MTASSSASPLIRAGLTAAAFALAGMGAGAVFRSLSSGQTEKGAAAARSAGESPLGKPGRAPAGIAAKIDAFLRAGTPAQQLAAALRLAEHGTAEEIRALLDEAYRFPAHSAGTLASLALLQRWLALEPEAAAEYCRIHMGDYLPKVIASWSAADPEKAEKFLLALPPGETRTDGWVALCQATAARDPDSAWALLRRMPGNPYREFSFSLRGVVGQLVAADPEGAMKRMADMPASVLRATRNAVSQELMKTDPARAWEWISQQPNPAELMREALPAGLATDPARALDWFAAASPALREKAMNDLGYNGNVSIGNFPALATALAQNQSLPADERSRLAKRLLSISSWRSPLEATALLPLLPGSQVAESTGDLLRNWRNRDQAAADAWVDGLPEGPVALAARAERTAMENAAPEPDRDTFAGYKDSLRKGFSYGDANERVAALTVEQVKEIYADPEFRPNYQSRELISQLAEHNPTAGAAWLETQELDDKSGPQAANFSAKWANEDPAAAAAWVSTLPAGALARTAAENVARQYQRHAPAQAAAWIQTLPAGPVRDAAAQALAPAP